MDSSRTSEIKDSRSIGVQVDKTLRKEEPTLKHQHEIFHYEASKVTTTTGQEKALYVMSMAKG